MTFNMANWGWPQWAVFILMLVGLAATAALHGQAKKGEHNAFIGWFSQALYLFLLIAGGFYA